MKYTVHGFSQPKAVELDLDMNDLAILRYFVDFKDSGKMYSEIIDGKTYYWLKYEGVIEQLPTLKLKKDAIYRRIKKMCSLGILEHKTIKRKGVYSFYTLGPRYIEMVSDLNPNDLSKNTPVGFKTEWGSDLKPEGYGFKTGTNNSSINNSSNNVIIENLQEIIDYYCSKALILETNMKPAEIQAAIKIVEDKIPINIVKQGIDIAFKNFKPNFEGDKIKTFKYCVPVIRSLWAKEIVKKEGVKGGADRNNSGEELRQQGIGI